MNLDTLLRPETIRGACLTFDDGYKSVFSTAFPIMKEYGVLAHLFLATGAIGRQQDGARRNGGDANDMLNWDDIASLHGQGYSIESHTRSHCDMRELSAEEIVDECTAADAEIDTRLGVSPRYFAYPYGWHNRKARDYVRSNYQAGLTTELRCLRSTEDSSALPRLDSYYLRSHWALRNLDSLLLRGYLSFRSAMRRVKGSQVAADCD